MAAQGKGSKWGSFLTQAVAGVEARLDNMLADGEEANKQRKSTPTPASSQPAKAGPAPARAGTSNRTNDRLQERLARAVAAKNAAAGSKPESSPARTSPATSPRPSADTSNRPSIDSVDRPKEATLESTSPRLPQAAGDEASRDVHTATGPTIGSESAKETVAEEAELAIDPIGPVEAQEQEEAEDAPISDEILSESNLTASQVEETPGAEAIADLGVQIDDSTASLRDPLHESRIQELEKELQEIQRQHQEETHDYVEKIDALQAKLQYLARETSDSARKAALAAPAGSAESKLAEKDQQIAQLMEEGKTLGVTEQKHRAIIKRLRAKIAEDEKGMSALRASKIKAEADLEPVRQRAKRAAELQKAQDDLHKRISQLQREQEATRSDAALKEKTIAELRAQLQKAAEHADALSVRINDEALSKERQRVKDLEEQVAALQVEKNLVADRAKAQANELMEKAERAAERARAVEVEMKAEVQVMESKLEAMRVRAEEASSGATGDSQAKLLRQVETLQTQYSVASENWQSIEATLLARVASLEKERDEALQRESEMRKKAREAALRAKRHEEELEDARTRLPTVQEDVKSYQAQLEAMKKRAEAAEAALAEAKAEFEREKAAWNESREEKEERHRERSNSQDRRSWLEDLPSQPIRSNSRPESPLLHGPTRTWSTDLLGLQAPANKLRKVSAPSSMDEPVERYLPRRASQAPSRPSTQAGLPAHPTPPLLSPAVEGLPTPSFGHPMDQDDSFEGIENASSSQNVMQDMVSVSTVAAGPSVQLVERMSAAVRRLEGEKMAAREELARISHQRDEARAEIVALMREAEAGKAALKKAADLEGQIAEVNARYETTLELLGEKSELVEELRADVEDVKAMYRDLVERTIK